MSSKIVKESHYTFPVNTLPLEEIPYVEKKVAESFVCW